MNLLSAQIVAARALAEAFAFEGNEAGQTAAGALLIRMSKSYSRAAESIERHLQADQGNRPGSGKRARRAINSALPILMPDGPFTRDFIMSARTPAGAWTAKQLAAWGVAWPARHGWIDRLIAGETE